MSEASEEAVQSQSEEGGCRAVELTGVEEWRSADVADDRIADGLDGRKEPSAVPSEAVDMNSHNLPINPRGSGAVLGWSAVQELNWDVIFLLGGGFALSRGFQESGLSEWMSTTITSKGGLSLPAITVLATLAACGATNVMSNVATANILLPALACVGPKHHVAPLVVLAPVALGTSLALLFPIGTPPNAIVLANGNVQLGQMARVGAICTALSLAAILLYCLCIMPLVLDISDVPQSVLDSCGVTS